MRNMWDRSWCRKAIRRITCQGRRKRTADIWLCTWWKMLMSPSLTGKLLIGCRRWKGISNTQYKWSGCCDIRSALYIVGQNQGSPLWEGRTEYIRRRWDQRQGRCHFGPVWWKFTDWTAMCGIFRDAPELSLSLQHTVWYNIPISTSAWGGDYNVNNNWQHDRDKYKISVFWYDYLT